MKTQSKFLGVVGLLSFLTIGSLASLGYGKYVEIQELREEALRPPPDLSYESEVVACFEGGQMQAMFTTRKPSEWSEGLWTHYPSHGGTFRTNLCCVYLDKEGFRATSSMSMPGHSS